MKAEYLSECRKLSLTARSAVGLLVVEEYFRSKNIRTKDTEEYLNYMWEWPVVVDFDSWESNRPFLVNYALGDVPSTELMLQLETIGLSESLFRNVVSGPVEILWGSFWGAAENDSSHNVLAETIRSSGLEQLPVLTPFKFSVFNKDDGWGKPVTKEDRDFWRDSVKYV